METRLAPGARLKTFLLTAAALCLSACETHHIQDHRVRLTIYTNSGAHSVAQVVQTDYGEPPRWISVMDNGSLAVRGEPPAVDLGDGRVVFATWVCSNGYDFDSNKPNPMMGLPGFPLPYPRNRNCSSPLLTTFGNLADPATVRAIDPNNPAAALGADVRAIEVTTEPTTDPPTHGKTQKYLPWLSSWRWNSAFLGLDGKANGRRGSWESITLEHALSQAAFVGDWAL